MKAARQGNDEARGILQTIQQANKQMKIDSEDNTIYDLDEQEKKSDGNVGENHETDVEKTRVQEHSQRYQNEL